MSIVVFRFTQRSTNMSLQLLLPFCVALETRHLIIAISVSLFQECDQLSARAPHFYAAKLLGTSGGVTFP